VLCLQKETVLKDLKNVKQSFNVREQWLEKMAKDCRDAIFAAGENSTKSIRSYAQTLEEVANKSSENPVRVLEVCQRLRACCDKLEAMHFSST
jgi:DNA repair ATPase RecN